MVLDNTQRTRNDVDVLDITTVSTQIDNHPSLTSPYPKEIGFDNVSSLSNVWFENDENDLETSNFVEHDVVNIMFDYDEMGMKVIGSLELGFTISTDYPVNIEKVGIVDLTETYTDIQIAVNDASDIDISIDISEVNTDDIVSLIEQSRFGIFVELSGGLINSRIIISNMVLVSEFGNVLQDEIDAVKNRLELANINTDTYSKEEIDKIVEDIVSVDIDLEGYMKWQDYTNDLGNQTDTSEFLKALDNTITAITGRGDL